MDKTKTLKKPRKSLKKSIVVNGVKLIPHDPSAIFKNHKKIKAALAEALIDGDKDGFVEILSGYVRTHNISEVCLRTGLSRTVVYEAKSEEVGGLGELLGGVA